MKKICRNLSIATLIVIMIVATALIVIGIRKPNNKEIYATSVNFKSIAGAVEIYAGNKIVLSRNIVDIKPADCTVEPEFLFKKYGQSGETKIKGGTYKFEDEDKYILICRVKSGDTYYVEDRLTIDVVNTPRETTSFYIQKLNIANLYMDESVALDKLVHIKHSDNSTVDVVCDEYLEYNNGIITPIKEGDCRITIVLTDNHVAVCHEISLRVNPSVINADVKLMLTLGDEVLSTNIIEKEYSQFSFDIGYTLVNLDRNQAIECWAEGDVVEVERYNSPTIRLKPLNRGRTKVYVKPVERPELMFEIIVIII